MNHHMGGTQRLRLAARILRNGGVVAYPTEGVYGLGCDPLWYPAVQRIWDIKGRRADKGLILIGAQPNHFQPYLSSHVIAQLVDADAEQPVPPHGSTRATTWVVACRDTPMWLTGGRTSLAVRLTKHPRARALCVAFGGALVSTSANVSGFAAARTALQVQRWLTRAPDWVLGGAVGRDTRPSRIIELASGKLLRN